MKNLLAFIIATLLFCSCSPERSELWYEKDGSGKVEVTIDLGEMAGMAKGMIESMDESSDKKLEGDIWDKGEMIDSTMNFYAIMPDSIKESMDNPELLKNLNMHMKIDSEKEYAKIKMSIDYESQDQLKDIMSTLKSAQSRKQGGMMAMAGDQDNLGAMFDTHDIDLKNGIIRLAGTQMDDMSDDPEFDEMMQALENPEASEDPELAEILKMMFGGDTETVIHAPGKILFTNDYNARIDGNTVTFRDNIMEVLKAGKSPDRIIKFEN